MVTTFLAFDPICDHVELASLAKDVSILTGKYHAVETSSFTHRYWFKPNHTTVRVALMIHVDRAVDVPRFTPGEYQVMTCVRSVGEAFAYLYGVCNGARQITTTIINTASI